MRFTRSIQKLCGCCVEKMQMYYNHEKGKLRCRKRKFTMDKIAVTCKNVRYEKRDNQRKSTFYCEESACPQPVDL